MALSDDLKAFYSLEEASGDAIDAHNSHNMTNASVGSATGKVGNARDFESDSGSRFSINHHADFSPGSTSFSICAWVKMESITGNDVIYAKQDASDAEWDLQIANFGGSYGARLYIYESAGYSGQKATPNDASLITTTGNWYFIACGFDALNTESWVSVNDGTVIKNTAISTVYSSTANVCLGFGQYVGYFDGLIDQVGFWRRVLTTDEITFLYNSGAGRSYAEIAGGGAGGKPYHYYQMLRRQAA